MQWKELPTETIHLLNGTTLQININGRSSDDPLGYAYIAGKEICVKQVDGEWYEVDEQGEIGEVYLDGMK